MIDERKKADLYNAFENADTILLKKYISTLNKLPLVEVSESITDIKVGSNACLYHIDKIVYDKYENIHDKLMTVYTSLLSDEKVALVMIIKGAKTHVDLYLGVVSRNINEQGGVPVKTLENAGKTLVNVFKGNFSGTELHRIDNARRKDEQGNFISDSVESVIESCFKQTTTIASVSGIAALRNQNEHDSERFVQGMEKLVDSMRGKEYAAIYIADVMSTSVIERICAEYEDIYSQLSPFKQSVHTLNENNSKTDTTSLIEGVVNTTNESLAKVVTHGTSHTITKTNTVGGSVNININVGGETAPVKVGGGVSADYHHSRGQTDGTSETIGNTTTEGKAQSLSKQNSIANAITSGSGESLQITYDNRAVKTLLDRIDEHIKRLRNCEDFGLFDGSVYFVADKYENAVSAASTYKSLIRGENSSVESAAINVWTQKKENKDIEWLTQYIKRFYHPMFALQTVWTADGKNDLYLPVTPALMVSGKELAYQFSLPKKSISGLPVVECASFGRNVLYAENFKEGKKIDFGVIHHMYEDENERVLLDKDSLTSHAFITGSTGSGKSNAIYQLIRNTCFEMGDNTDKTHFMIIEPAKGEYKDIFGGYEDVLVLGTNPYKSKLLRINPFSFPEDIHILEHIDRLIEIFNVCWPMYAAMPAVLKEAIERAYEVSGWDLNRSECSYGNGDKRIFPCFIDVLNQVNRVIKESEYSSDSKGDYVGALSMRISSLTNGINGQILTNNAIPDAELFSQNVIVDLSRVGSTETKALLMGLLIIKLQEYRMSCASGSNKKLSHLTVLEEAHNLLKRTSSEQSVESSNLTGKSVEMLANAIAEMRTYGEGFVIADQSPGLMDMSVIRNTNTKIILRLPDATDRELVGKAANLNDQQIVELAKLRTGVCAVYQNNWIEPVLCHVDEWDDKKFSKKYDGDTEDLFDTVDTKKRIVKLVLQPIPQIKAEEIESLVADIDKTRLSTELKTKLYKLAYEDDVDKARNLRKTIIYEIFSPDAVLERNICYRNEIKEWVAAMQDELMPRLEEFDEKEVEQILTLLAIEKTRIEGKQEYEELINNLLIFIDGGRRMM